MNTMTTALQEAGVALPSIYERIWRYFKDHPRSSSLACTQVLKLSRANVSSYISEMESRRMIRSEPVEMRLRGAHGAYHNRKVKHYTVNIAEFEMLPKPKKPARKVKKTTPLAAPVATPPTATISVVSTPPATLQDWSAEQLVHTLTPRQARAVYDQLKEIFG